MKIVQAVAPTIEPVSLAEAKLHLRVDTGSLSDNVDELQSIAPGSHAIAADYTTHVGTAIDVLGYSSIIFLNSGTNGAGGTVDCKIQESDDNILWTDWTGGAFTQITEANDNAIYEIAYTGTKRYVRTVAKVLIAACVFGSTVMRFAASSSEDTELTSIIQSSREHIEEITRRALLTQTWDYYLDVFPRSNYIKIPLGNLASVTHVKYTDSDGTQTTMTVSTDYIVEANGEGPGRIVLPYSVPWPSFTAYPSNPIVIRFVCGWTSAAAVPEIIRNACKLCISYFYDNRGIDDDDRDLKFRRRMIRMLASKIIWDEFQ